MSNSTPDEPWKRFRKYTRISSLNVDYGPCDRKTEYALWLLVATPDGKRQEFRVNQDVELDDADHVECFADQLAKALWRLVENERKERE